MIIFPFLMRRRFDDNVLHVKFKLILLEKPFLESLSCTHVLSCIRYIVSCTLVDGQTCIGIPCNFGTSSVYAATKSVINPFLPSTFYCFLSLFSLCTLIHKPYRSSNLKFCRPRIYRTDCTAPGHI